MNTSSRRSFVAASLLLVVASLLSSQLSAQDRNANQLEALRNVQRETHKKFAESLEKLALEMETRGKPVAATTIREKIRPVTFSARKRVKLPVEKQAEIPENLPEDDRYWQTQLRFLSQEYAKQTYLAARRAVGVGLPSHAYDLIHDVVQYDPDHREARKILGYLQSGNSWVSPAAFQLRQKHVYDPQFGWVIKSHIDRYRNGERNVDGRWVSVEKEEELRRDFQRAWQVRTDHFLVKTNHSREKGIELATALETFHEYVQDSLAPFFHTPEQLRQMFEQSTKSPQLRSKPFVVHFYRDKEEYVKRLKSAFPQIELTNGVYIPRERVVHAFHEEKANHLATIFHEATHQILYELHDQQREIGEFHHFWIIEGIACYMESFEIQNGVGQAGDPSFLRFQNARMTLLGNRQYTPLLELTSENKREFQGHTHEQLLHLYSQSAGMTHFFLHYDNGRYRDALLRQLSDLYSRDARVREKTPDLATLIGVAASELDQKYREYMIQQAKDQKEPYEVLNPP